MTDDRKPAMNEVRDEVTETLRMSNRVMPVRCVAAVMAGLALGAGGCSKGIPSNFGVAEPVSSIRLSGYVHGGQNPVKNSTIHLYTVGTSGTASASTDITNTTVQTDANGNYTLTGLYSCSNATDVYIVSQGGDSGSGTNSSISLAAALGPCSGLSASTFTVINEVTTVAAAYALAPFSSGYANVGANFGGSTTVPSGLANAFTNAGLLANTTTGSAGATNATAGLTVPVLEMNTLGNIVGSCINTLGATSSACQALFGATGASDTFGAALAMAKHPGASAVTALYVYSTSTAPFQPSTVYTTAPTDFTLAVSMAGSSGTLATPYGVAIDAAGDAWVTNESGALGSGVAEFTPGGAVVNNGSVPYITGAEGIAIDKSNNVWVANTAGNSLVEIARSGAGAITATNNYTSGMNGPTAVAVDSQGHVFTTNLNGNNVLIDNNGSFSTVTGNGLISVPTGVAVGPDGSVYVTSGNGTVVKLANNGTYSASLNDGFLQGPVSVAADSAGHVLATGYTTGTAIGAALSEFSGGSAAVVSPVSAGLTSPAGVASDGTSIWVANGGGSLAQYSYGSATPVSPTAGFGSLSAPVGVAVDSSGSVWTANSGSNTVSKFIGLAAAVATPLAANVGP